MKLNHQKSLVILQSKKNEVFEANRVFDSDGDIEDEGALDFAGELSLLIDAINNKEPDQRIVSFAQHVGLEEYLRFD